MKKHIKRRTICAAIVLGSVLLTLAMGRIQFFKGVDLKAQDAHFVVRGTVPTKDILLVEMDNTARSAWPEPLFFWQRFYADAMRAAADGGAKVMVLDVAFLIPVDKYVNGNDEALAGAFLEASQRMPVICAFVAADTSNQQDSRFAVPLNMAAATFGLSAFPNLTVDSDDFARRQELMELPKTGAPGELLARGLAMMAAEKFLGKEVEFRGGKMYLADREIPLDKDRTLTINYAGPPDTFPRISLYDLVTAYRAGDKARIEKWVKGKAILLGPQDSDDRHPTPFYTAFATSQWRTPGVEIHANVLQTLLSGKFLKPAPEWVLYAALILSAGLCMFVVTSFRVSHTAIWSSLIVVVLLAGTHVLFLHGWLLSTSQMLLAFGWALLGGTIYRFATAEKKSSFFKSAVALFVGKQVATSLEESQKISMVGKREMVTILFTDIRGFTAFCESKDPAIVVDLLNVYMANMVSIIVKYGGHVNKFIGDGILAVFSDEDPEAQPGDHAIRAVRCATQMVEQVIGEFRTGAGLHSGEVVIGNVGSSDKLEFTVLGNTVNLASRLESLNKDQKTRLLMSEESFEMLGGAIDTIYLGSVPVKGKTTKMKLFTVTALLDQSRVQDLRADDVLCQPEHVA